MNELERSARKISMLGGGQINFGGLQLLLYGCREMVESREISVDEAMESLKKIRSEQSFSVNASKHFDGTILALEEALKKPPKVIKSDLTIVN